MESSHRLTQPWIYSASRKPSHSGSAPTDGHICHIRSRPTAPACPLMAVRGAGARQYQGFSLAGLGTGFLELIMGRPSAGLFRKPRILHVGPSSSCGCLVFLVSAAHHDLERVIRQWPLQRLRLIPRRTHPDVALFIRGQDYRHRFRMNRLDHGVRRGRKEAVIASSRPLFALRITGAG